MEFKATLQDTVLKRGRSSFQGGQGWRQLEQQGGRLSVKTPHLPFCPSLLGHTSLWWSLQGVLFSSVVPWMAPKASPLAPAPALWWVFREQATPTVYR